MVGAFRDRGWGGLEENCWIIFFLERRVGLVEDEIIGLNLSSFQLLFILHWEISQLVVANKKLFFNFDIFSECYSYIRILQVKLLLFVLHEKSR